MGAWQSVRMKLLMAVPLVVVFVVVVLLALRPSSESPMKGVTERTSPANSAAASPTYHLLRVTPPQTAIERTANAIMAQNENSGSFTSSQAAQLPGAATCAAFPSIDAADSSLPSMYALAFTQELLDVDFATSTRQELLAWASYNNAPNTLANIPATVNLKILPGSLAARPALLPTKTQWATMGALRTRWRVSGLVISVSPIWTQMLSTGWKPVDPLMVMYDVSGTLTVTTSGRAPVVESIFFGLTIGGASWHPGYGAVAVDYWTVN
jgi:hypothetical protein